MADDDPLAYGDYHGDRGNAEGEATGERGFFGDTLTKLKKNDGISNIFNKVHGGLHGLSTNISDRVTGFQAAIPKPEPAEGTANRFGSFAPMRGDGNNAKYYVDGCNYMWAVSVALERARESIWILDWWLSPELYLRRPPAKNEQYRLDRMLQAAAERGVKVNIIVYKEVAQALTRKYLSPTIPEYLYSLLPWGTDPITSVLSRLGIAATFASFEYLEEENPLITPPITVNSNHTKHHLEDLHKGIAVFRHPDHLPDAPNVRENILSSFQNLSLNAASLSKLPTDTVKGLYGIHEGVVLYWAHHEKLCLIDGQTAFMGGLDLCYGRWDTNQHAIADAHPTDLKNIVFPGQDFNNARIMDFADIPNWEQNKLNRSEASRMGWSDISIALNGPVTNDLRRHFMERWNFIFDEKYQARRDERYSRFDIEGTLRSSHNAFSGNPEGQGTSFPPPPTSSARGYPDNDLEQAEDRGFDDQGERQHHRHRFHDGEGFRERLEHGIHHVQEEYMGPNVPESTYPSGGVAAQILRSSSKWSHGIDTENSIANAYANVIKNSQHFIYIENQFFITATVDAQKPIKNKIGAAIVERILRAARSGENFMVIVIMPAVPAFAGDLQEDSSLGTRAIMEFQYNSINRGGYSIMEQIGNAGFDPTQYIRFYNLRSYDRINTSTAMEQAEMQSGVDYETARKEHDKLVDPAGYNAEQRGGYPQDPDYPADYGEGENYQRYQQAAEHVSDGKGILDSVADCYMLGGRDIRQVPWEGNVPEIEAIVSEELYVHSKVLIADDRVVICGSANLNDRSQLGYHDSEIAVIVEDPEQIDSYMDGRPFRASKFAATLRRQLFRKHIGLIPAQEIERPDQNYEPVGVPNFYDFGSREDTAVMDPLSTEFLGLWNRTARTNTEVFGRIFHPVPHDDVRDWNDYAKFFTHYFHEGQTENPEDKSKKTPAKYKWGHVVEENFPPGEQGVREVKELLSTVRGNLVEMPLLFLIKEDIAKEGVSLNAFTEDIYT